MMKLLTILAVLPLLSCSPVPAENPVEEEPVQEEQTTGKASDMGKLLISNGKETLSATFEDNSSAKAFAERLAKGPVTVDMSDYGAFEKVGSLGFSLPRNDKRITTKPGDVILYQGNQITIYYDTNTWSFTLMAKIDGADKRKLLSFLGEGDVKITFSLSSED
ncbi:MAG: hypothetical protein IJ202_14725 [Bacteroidales bacterium]|nr:hypothetical protein [Bacteroidales bacterium]